MIRLFSNGIFQRFAWACRDAKISVFFLLFYLFTLTENVSLPGRDTAFREITSVRNNRLEHELDSIINQAAKT